MSNKVYALLIILTAIVAGLIVFIPQYLVENKCGSDQICLSPAEGEDHYASTFNYMAINNTTPDKQQRLNPGVYENYDLPNTYFSSISYGFVNSCREFFGLSFKTFWKYMDFVMPFLIALSAIFLCYIFFNSRGLSLIFALFILFAMSYKQNCLSRTPYPQIYLWLYFLGLASIFRLFLTSNYVVLTSFGFLISICAGVIIYPFMIVPQIVISMIMVPVFWWQKRRLPVYMILGSGAILVAVYLMAYKIFSPAMSSIASNYYGDPYSLKFYPVFTLAQLACLIVSLLVYRFSGFHKNISICAIFSGMVFLTAVVGPLFQAPNILVYWVCQYCYSLNYFLTGMMIFALNYKGEFANLPVGNKRKIFVCWTFMLILGFSLPTELGYLHKAGVLLYAVMCLYYGASTVWSALFTRQYIRLLALGALLVASVLIGARNFYVLGNNIANNIQNSVLPYSGTFNYLNAKAPRDSSVMLIYLDEKIFPLAYSTHCRPYNLTTSDILEKISLEDRIRRYLLYFRACGEPPERLINDESYAIEIFNSKWLLAANGHGIAPHDDVMRKPTKEDMEFMKQVVSGNMKIPLKEALLHYRLDYIAVPAKAKEKYKDLNIASWDFIKEEFIDKSTGTILYRVIK